MTSDTTTMSAMSHQLTGGRLVKSEESQVMCSVGLRASTPPPYFLRYAYDLHHLGDRMDAHDVRTRKDRAGNGGRSAPIPFGRRPVLHRGTQVRFPRRPDEDGPLHGLGNLVQPCQHTIAVLRPFGKPDPRIDDDSLE